jgi:hypothetical protein
MSYATGETPEVGDHVVSRQGRPGVITWVQLDYPSTPGHDAVSIKWDDGGVGIGIAMADEFRFVRRADK